MSQPDKGIDLARVGLSKSLMTSPCERKGFYGETIRDANGRRLRFPMPEKVTFGTAVDEAVAFMLWSELHDVTYAPADAVTKGMTAAMAQDGWSLVEDPRLFRSLLAEAVGLYVTEDNGLARILPLRDENIKLQGNDGESLRSGDIIGTPDILTDRRVGDVKTAAKAYSDSKFTASAEMPTYTLLFAAQNGELPDSLFYQVYVRTKRPYWQWLETTNVSPLVDLARAHAAHWRKVIDTGDAELTAFNTLFCGDCPFRQPLPDVGFAGCDVGVIVPPAREAAA